MWFDFRSGNGPPGIVCVCEGIAMRRGVKAGRDIKSISTISIKYEGDSGPYERLGKTHFRQS